MLALEPLAREKSGSEDARSQYSQLNAALCRVALTQSRCSPAAQAYLARRSSEGTTRREAIRALTRHLIRAIWREWEECQPQTAGAAAGIAA